MIRNFYTLQHIAREINSLSGWVADECFSQDKDNLVISLNDGKRESFIVFIADGKYDSVYVQKKFGKAKKNAVSLLQDLEGDVLQSAEVLDKNRILKITFLHSTVYIVLFGGLNSNFVITNSQGILLDSFKSFMTAENGKFKPEISEYRKLSEFTPETEIKSALANSDYLFGSTYSNEIFHRIAQKQESIRHVILNEVKNPSSFSAKEDMDSSPATQNDNKKEVFNKVPVINPKKLLGELSESEFNLIINESDKFVQELQNSEKFYVFEDDKYRKIMSPVFLSGYKLLSEHETASEAVHRKIVSDIIDTEFRQAYSTISNYLEKQKRKIDKALENMQDIDSARVRESQYRMWAELMMSQPNGKIKNGDKIKLQDWDGNEIEIKLDPKLNLYQNAKKYFDKAHSTNEDIRVRAVRLPEMLEKQKAVNEKLRELSLVRHIKELSRFETGIKKVTGERVNTSKMTMEDKFRKFDLGEGYILYAGKNASNNDELTMKFAKPNDVWLHARGTSGSHTVIRMDKEEKPPKAVLQKAAEITAYYSGARNAKYVPVIWTYKKYVRKPKGANVGAVMVAKETVIMAEPKLSEGEK